MAGKLIVKRKTGETEIKVGLTLYGLGHSYIRTPLHFFNHMLETFAKHGLFNLEIEADGDLHVDQHHFLEDTGLMLGAAFRKALTENLRHNRSGFFVHTMDEALGIAAVDFCGRPWLQYDLRFHGGSCGRLDLSSLPDFFRGFSTGAMANLAIRGPFGRSDHHKSEAVFKSFARAVRMACAENERSIDIIQSTKGVIDDWNN